MTSSSTTAHLNEANSSHFSWTRLTVIILALVTVSSNDMRGQEEITSAWMVGLHKTAPVNHRQFPSIYRHRSQSVQNTCSVVSGEGKRQVTTSVSLSFHAWTGIELTRIAIQQHRHNQRRPESVEFIAVLTVTGLNFTGCLKRVVVRLAAVVEARVCCWSRLQPSPQRDDKARERCLSSWRGRMEL